MTSQFDLDAHLASPLRIVGDEAVVSPAPVVVLLSCYMTGSTEGRNLGIAGYSHDFVAKAFAPLLARYGEVRAVVDPRRNLQQEVDRLIAAQRRPVHFSVLPLQDVVLGERVANIAVPAWEFPDAPNEGFDGNPQNDWGATADRCDLVLVSGPFTKAALAGSGTTTAIGIVPVPVDDSYFTVPEWSPEHTVTLECRGYVFGPDNNLRVADSESSQNPDSVRRVIEFYRGRDVRHRCRLVVICDFLTEAQLLELTTATTFYLQATKAEGNCLPLMNHLAAGRPGVSPDHSSVGDYFDAQSGFVVASHPEPSAWPHDLRLRQRTTWARIVWPSLRDQIQASYRMASGSAVAYKRLSRSCRARMLDWAGNEAVARALDRTVGRLLAGVTSDHGAAPAADRKAA